MYLTYLLAAVGVVTTAGLAAALVHTRHRYQELRQRFAPMLDLERELAKNRAAAGEAQAGAERELERTRNETNALKAQYATGRERYEELKRAVESLEESLESIDVGLYRPHFTYADSESYKSAIEQTRVRQKELIKVGRAAICGTTWTVGGSQREGERMVKQTQKLILRAFNAESEAAVSNVSWNNYTVMEARINKAFEMLNKHGTVLQVNLADEYRRSRLEELKLVFEAAEKRQQEREEQRRQRAAQREEEKVQRELLREQEEATKDEGRYQKALTKARQELEAARDSDREAMEARIRELESDLAAAQSRKERAVAQAQLTKVGHVYVISNVGAFGEGVIKIGLTRRLDPEERVQELGDASVPFPFDIHAMIYSENAPELETGLHEHFWDKRLNWVNDRKEFFRITPAEVQAELGRRGLKAELSTVPEAKEFRQTVATMHQSLKTTEGGKGKQEDRFPADLFADEHASDGSDR